MVIFIPTLKNIIHTNHVCKNLKPKIFIDKSHTLIKKTFLNKTMNFLTSLGFPQCENTTPDKNYGIGTLKGYPPRSIIIRLISTVCQPV